MCSKEQFSEIMDKIHMVCRILKKIDAFWYSNLFFKKCECLEVTHTVAPMKEFLVFHNILNVCMQIIMRLEKAEEKSAFEIE